MGYLTQNGPYGYSRGHRALEVAGIALFLLGVAIAGIRMARGVDDPGDLAGLGACVLLGYLLADLLSGLVHWAGDTLGNERTPILGAHFIVPFREHHIDPQGICRHDFVQTNGNNCIVAVPVVAFVSFLMPSQPGFGFWTGAVITFVALFVFLTNQFHKWAHADGAPQTVRLLQRMGLILSKRHHDTHHAPPHDKYYCITVGWLNPLLSKVRFFRALEWVVSKVRPEFLHVEERLRPPPAASGAAGVAGMR